MGPEALIPLLISAGGTAMQMSAQRDQQKQQRRILNRQMDENKQATDKAAQLVQQEAAKMAPDARQQEMVAQEQAVYDQQQKDLQTGAGGGAVIDAAGSAGNVSADFLKAKADRAIDEGSRLSAIARELAKTRAPSQVMMQEGLGRAAMAGNLNSMWGSRRNMSSAAGMDAQSVQQPLYGALGQAVAAYGASGGGSNWFTPASGVVSGGSGVKAGTGGTGMRAGSGGSGLRINWG